MKLTEGERRRLGRVPTGNPEAYDLVLRGFEEIWRMRPETNAEA